MKNLIKKVKNIEGFLTDIEIDFLFSLASNLKGKNPIVEIGSYKGKSTVSLALGASKGNNNLLVAIDPFTGSPEHRKGGKILNTKTEFQKNLKRFKLGNIKVLAMTSMKALNRVDSPISFVFIDGNHDLKHTKQDFKWVDKLELGGVLAMHDTLTWEGPKKVVFKEVLLSRKFKNPKLRGSIVSATKCSPSVIEMLKKIPFTLLFLLRSKVDVNKLSPKLRERLKSIFYRLQ